MSARLKTYRAMLVLTGLVLTAQTASAFYNPNTGRWLSRDPIGEAGSLNVYASMENNALNSFDADGRLTIDRVNFVSYACGGRLVQWIFRLDQPAPCDGFLVQKIDRHDRVANCCEPPVDSVPAEPTETFWEAWFIRAGNTLDEEFQQHNYTDQDFRGSMRRKTGIRINLGEIKFFCMATTGDLNDPASGWPRGGVSGTGTLPSTSNPPIWWTWDWASIEGPAYRSASSWWDCCSGSRNEVTADP